MTYANGSRIAEIRKNSYGEFEAFIGYVEDKGIQRSGMQVVERKTYKRESGAKKFCEKWTA